MGCNTLATVSFEEGDSRKQIELWLFPKSLAIKNRYNGYSSK